MAKTFIDLIAECDYDEETQIQLVNIYHEPFFLNPFDTLQDLFEWCNEWEKTRKRLLSITAKRG